MYLVAALLSILMIFIAGLFLSAELEQQALKKAETTKQIADPLKIALKPSSHGLCGKGTPIRQPRCTAVILNTHPLVPPSMG